MVKLIAVAIVCALIIVYLRSINSEFALIATVGASIIIISFALDYVVQTFEFINQLVEYSGIDKDLYFIIFKITAIAYLVEFGAGTIRDFGLNSLADKLVFVGKIIILSMSLPIIYAVFNLFLGLTI